MDSVILHYLASAGCSNCVAKCDTLPVAIEWILGLLPDGDTVTHWSIEQIRHSAKDQDPRAWSSSRKVYGFGRDKLVALADDCDLIGGGGARPSQSPQ
jgi:hypothetical protein